MAPYPDLAHCGLHFMHFSFHVSGGLEDIDGFWEERGLDRARERLLFASYLRRGRPHTVYLQWARSHEGCSDVYLGVDARKPSVVWPRRPLKHYRLRQEDFREFIKLTREMDVPFGIRARYAYPWEKEMDPARRLHPRSRLKSLSFDILDDEENPAVNVTYERQGSGWIAVVEPLERFPFPDDENFFLQPYELGCLLAKTLRQERSDEQRKAISSSTS